MTQSNSRPRTWKDYADNLMPFMKPWIEECVRKFLTQKMDNDWSRALKVLDTVHQELLTLKRLVQEANTGEVPPSKAVQELLDRLSVLEEDHAQLKTDVALMMNGQ